MNKNKVDRLDKLIQALKNVLSKFKDEFGVSDVISNSKIYEVVIANSLKHKLIPGHSGSRDALDKRGEYEYKHFKESSSNHSWTFNDYSEVTINKLQKIEAVIFAHIEDISYPPILDWCYRVPGTVISKYLSYSTKQIKNTRKMINVSPKQIEKRLKIQKSLTKRGEYIYTPWLNKIFEISRKIELATKTNNILTSNKIWEVLVAAKLDHHVLSEQGGRAGAHDAVDDKGGYYEYKVSNKSRSWNFQDISERVLQKYEKATGIVLARVDKEELEVLDIYVAESDRAIKRLKEKLREKRLRYKPRGGLRRLQVSLSAGDLLKIKADHIYKAT